MYLISSLLGLFAASYVQYPKSPNAPELPMDEKNLEFGDPRCPSHNKTSSPETLALDQQKPGPLEMTSPTETLSIAAEPGNEKSGFRTLSFVEIAASSDMGIMAQERNQSGPERIGRFEIRRWLGEGAFGAVYEAYDPQLDRAVAIKVAKLGTGDSEQRIKRFLREAKAAAGLRHPHIVPVHEFGQEEDCFHIVSSFIKGRTLQADLAERKKNNQPADLARAARIVRHLAEALAYAHGQGIVHRDVKPANVMLDEKDEPMLMDFGLATRQEEAEKLTHAGAILGTPLYMAPEQARGAAANALPASDQYSLGVMLYEMIAGQPPFAGPPELVMFHHMETEPASPRKHNRRVTRDLETICVKTLEKNAAMRYANCRLLADELRRWLEGETILARPVGIIERVRKWSKRNPLSATLLAAVMVTLIVGATIAGFFAIEAKHQEGLALDEASKARISEKKEKHARQESELRAIHLEFEHYFAKVEDRPDLALVGMASLLPKAARLENHSLAASIRLHVGVLSRRTTRLSAIFEHQHQVGAVALNADGRKALTGSHDKGQLWNPTTGKQGPPMEHGEAIRALALSADGTVALTASGSIFGADNIARFWDAATGDQIGPPFRHDGVITAVALSGDGKIALTGSADKTARLWNTSTSKSISTPLKHTGSVGAVALSLDGKTALTSSSDGARLWDTATGKLIGNPLENDPGALGIRAVALSADGSKALIGNMLGVVELWETVTETKPWRRSGKRMVHADWVTAVALSGDGMTALTGSRDRTARLWDMRTGKPIGTPLQHPHVVLAVAMSADNRTALTGCEDKTARLWETTIGRVNEPWPLNQDPVVYVALSADGKIALTLNKDDTIRLLETRTSKPIGPPLQHQTEGFAAALSADGMVALMKSKDKAARLWDLGIGKPIGKPLQHSHLYVGVNSLALSADGKTALTGAAFTARLWEAAAAKPIGLELTHKDSVVAVALSRDGKTALTGSKDKTAQLWETSTGKPIGPPLPHQAGIESVALSGDGMTALTGSSDMTARLWKTSTGKRIGPPLAHQDSVIAVALSGDGKIALTGSADKMARLWETATGRQIGPPLLHENPVSQVGLSADGRIVLTGSNDKTARLWPVPQPMGGDAERIMLWAQVVTGLEGDELTAVRILDATTWQQRLLRLQELGGPPNID